MISSVCWVPKGAAKKTPDQAEITEEELAAMKAAAEGGADDREEESDSDEDGSDNEMQDSSDDEELDEEAAVAKAKAFAASLKSSGGPSAASGPSPGGDYLASAMAELDMDNYDNSDVEDGPVSRILGSGNPGLSYYKDPRDDPFLKGGASDSDTDSDSELDDIILRDTDLLIVAARNEDDVSHLEVWVYEEPDERGGGNLYVHHTLMLSAFPLSVAWMDCDPTQQGGTGNFAAVGSFEPGIDIWNLDVLDAVEPVASLGGCDYEAARAAAAEGGKKKKKGSKKKKGVPDIPLRPNSHADAVLGLAWNSDYRNVLASASADKTVKVWDVATQQCQHTLTPHKGKVQAVAWNPVEAPVLLSGGFDKQACLTDCRTPDGDPIRWKVSADVEALTWDPHTPTSFAIATEDGQVSYFDARNGDNSGPLFTLGAHSKPTTALSFCPSVPGLMLTASTDKKIHLWKIKDNTPAQLASADLKVGAVFSASFCKDAPFVIAAGGAKGTVAVWDTTTVGSVVAYAESLGVNVPKSLYGTVDAGADGVEGQSLDEDDGSSSGEDSE